jgi:hypothetical protein
MQICSGLDDYFTCTLGTCIRLSDRPDWPIDWWERVDPAQFGGEPAATAVICCDQSLEAPRAYLQAADGISVQATHRSCMTHGSGIVMILRDTRLAKSKLEISALRCTMQNHPMCGSSTNATLWTSMSHPSALSMLITFDDLRETERCQIVLTPNCAQPRESVGRPRRAVPKYNRR